MKDFKRKSLKYIQSKLRLIVVKFHNFLNTEYRTEQEIEKDRVKSYAEGLKKIGPAYWGSIGGGWNSVGEIRYLKDRDTGETYFKDLVRNQWFSNLDENYYTDEEIKEKLSKNGN